MNNNKQVLDNTNTLTEVQKIRLRQIAEEVEYVIKKKIYLIAINKNKENEALMYSVNFILDRYENNNVQTKEDNEEGDL